MSASPYNKVVGKGGKPKWPHSRGYTMSENLKDGERERCFYSKSEGEKLHAPSRGLYWSRLRARGMDEKLGEWMR